MAMPLDMPMIGQTRKTLFWSILLVALLALTLLISLASRGAIAMASTIPVPFLLTNQSLTARNFKLYPGISSADNSTPVAIQQLDATVKGLVITKKFSIMGRTVTMTMTAGSKATPVTASGLTIDANSVNVDSVRFTNMTLSAAGTGGLENDASTGTFSNVVINSPFLLANSITLPDLSVAISIS